MKKLITLSAMAIMAVANLCLAQDTTKVDKYAFPPLPQELKHADNLLATGDSTNGLAELRAIVNSKAEDEVKARAQYEIARYYSEVVPKLIEQEAFQLSKNDTSRKATVRRFKKELEMKDLNKKVAYTEYLKVSNNYATSGYAPKAMMAASFFAPDTNDQIQLLRKVIDENPNSAIGKNAHQVLARVYESKRDFPNTVKEWQQVLNGYPQDRWSCAEAMYKIAKLTEGAGKIKAYEKVISSYPDQEHWALEAYTGIAWYYESRGDIPKAIDIRLQTVKKYPKHGGMPNLLEEIMYDYQHIGKWEESQEIRRRILRGYPNSDIVKDLLPKK